METVAFVSAPPEDYICQICMKVLQEPHATECCGQHYCKGCLEKWFEKNHGKKECPHCREVNFGHILYKPLQRKIKELEVQCSNRDLGCMVILKLEELDSHLSVSNPSGCGYVPFPCQNGCGLALFRVCMDQHVVKECDKRPDICTHCDVTMSHDQLTNHYEVCEEVQLSCPSYCGEIMRRGDLGEHEGVCVNVPVKCPFFDSGCRVKLTRKMLEEHIEKNATAHLMYLAAGYSSLKASNDSLKADVDHLKAENVSLKEESEDMKSKFETFKSQMAVELTGVKDVLEMPNSKISMSLECMGSLLRGHHLKSAAEKVVFPVPDCAGMWQSPPFFVNPAYEMCVRFTLRTLELVLLKGAADGHLKWPEDMKQSVVLTLYSHKRRGPVRTPQAESPHLEELASQEMVVSFELSLTRWKDMRNIGSHYVYDRPLYISVHLEKQEVPDNLSAAVSCAAPEKFRQKLIKKLAEANFRPLQPRKNK